MLLVQVGFVEQLWSSGVIDEQEREMMVEPLDKMERRLIRHGPAWQPPPAVDVSCSRFLSVCTC